VSNERERRTNGGLIAAVFLALAALLLAACPADEEAPEEDNGEEAAAPENGEIEIGWIPWDEAIAVTNLWEVLLTDRGYEVTQTQLEVGGLYVGIAQGDLDLFLDAWLPATHEDYMEEHGDEIEDLGTWYEEAPLTWTVPAYLDDVDSIEDLQGNADMFDGQIIGIEAGAGLTRISLEEVMPTYDLEDDYTLVEGSTPAMLAELQNAVDGEDPVVVTLWRPHWIYDELELKDLEDPENALGDPDSIHVVARSGFSEDFAEVACALENFEMGDDDIASLSALIQEHGEGGELDAAREWLEDDDNQALADGWFEDC
jgi:glycine betaine/proline transport system substrate-binding protein